MRARRKVLDIIVVYTEGADFSVLEKYLGCVSKARKATVLKKAADEDKVQSLVAALLLRSELSKRLGIPHKKTVFEKGAHGKPYIRGGGAQFSVSHTRGAVCVAVSESDMEIGVDIERRDRRIIGKLKERTLSKNELAQLSSDEDFLRMWVQKEAFLKRTGIGLTTVIRGVDTTVLKDLAVYECGAYFVGVAGTTANEAQVRVLPLDELLAGFDD